MKSSLIRAGVAATAAFAAAGVGLLTLQHMGQKSADREPVVVELFTSASCPQCPAAENALAELVARQPLGGVEIVPLALHVDYGALPMKPDPLACPENIDRQKLYNEETLFTPQLVIDGQPQQPGCSRERLEAAISSAGRQSKGVIHLNILERSAQSLRLSLRINPMSRTGSDVYLAVVENGVPNPALKINDEVPNQLTGVTRSLRHVADLMPGDEEYVTQTDVVLDPAWNVDRLRLVAFAQRQSDRAIVAVGRVRVQP